MTLATLRQETLWTEAVQLMPGGVNSPVRAFRAVGGQPVFIARASGPWLWDEDGKQYVVIAAGGHKYLGTTLGDALVAYTLEE